MRPSPFVLVIIIVILSFFLASYASASMNNASDGVDELRSPLSDKASFTATNPKTLDELKKMHEVADQLMAVRDVEKALKIYQDILFMEPDDEIAYVDMGRAYMILGQYKNAAQAFSNALDINPDNEVAQMGLQKIYDPDQGFGRPSDISDLDRISTNQALQLALRNAGTYLGPINGARTSALEKAIIAFKKVRGLGDDTSINEDTWKALEPYMKISDALNANDGDI